jgi:hypothetical protein
MYIYVTKSGRPSVKMAIKIMGNKTWPCIMAVAYFQMNLLG